MFKVREQDFYDRVVAWMLDKKKDLLIHHRSHSRDGPCHDIATIWDLEVEKVMVPKLIIFVSVGGGINRVVRGLLVYIWRVSFQRISGSRWNKSF